MALINRQTYVNDGGGRSTSTTTKPKTVQPIVNTYTPKPTTQVNPVVTPVVNTYKPSTPTKTQVSPTATSVPTAGRTKHVVTGNLAPIEKTTVAENYPVNPSRVAQYPTQNTVGSFLASLKKEDNSDKGSGSGSTGKVAPVVEVAPEPTYGGSGGSSQPSKAEQEQKEVEDTVSKIKELLDEQKRQADAYYKTLYEQQLANNMNDWERNRNQINMNYKRTNRYLNSMYGDAVSGTGLSNRARNYSNWNNYLATNDTNRTNNDATALASYNNNLANVASTLSQGYYNYVLPVYTNRQTNADNMDYQRWAYEQQLENNRRMNLDDLDYRRYLASLGLR